MVSPTTLILNQVSTIMNGSSTFDENEKANLFESIYNKLSDKGLYTVFEFIEYLKIKLQANMKSKYSDRLSQESDIILNYLEDGHFSSDEHTSMFINQRICNTHYLCDNM